LGKQVQLQVTYLVSYINIGSVEVSIHPMSALETLDNHTALATYTINARHKERMSVPKTTLFVHSGSPVNIRTKSFALRLPASVSQGFFLVAFTPVCKEGQAEKFKLLGLASC
jgi:hypothetical protein